MGTAARPPRFRATQLSFLKSSCSPSNNKASGKSRRSGHPEVAAEREVQGDAVVEAQPPHGRQRAARLNRALLSDENCQDVTEPLTEIGARFAVSFGGEARRFRE